MAASALPPQWVFSSLRLERCHSPLTPRRIMSAEPTPDTAPASSLHSKETGWSGRFNEPVADFVLRYTASVGFDRRLALVDIEGSLAHAAMLAHVGVLTAQDL